MSLNVQKAWSSTNSQNRGTQCCVQLLSVLILLPPVYTVCCCDIGQELWSYQPFPNFSQVKLFLNGHSSCEGVGETGLAHHQESMGPGSKGSSSFPLCTSWGSGWQQKLSQIAVPGIFLLPLVVEEEWMAILKNIWLLVGLLLVQNH